MLSGYFLHILSPTDFHCSFAFCFLSHPYLHAHYFLSSLFEFILSFTMLEFSLDNTRCYLLELPPELLRNILIWVVQGGLPGLTSFMCASLRCRYVIITDFAILRDVEIERLPSLPSRPAEACTTAYLDWRRMVSKSVNLGSNWGKYVNCILRVIGNTKLNVVADVLAKWNDRLGPYLLRIDRARVIDYFWEAWEGREQSVVKGSKLQRK